MIRFFDILFSFAGLILLLPLLAAIAIFIKIDSKGPVFFKQERVGRFGKNFLIYKFRSMYINTESHSQLTLGKSDARVTRIGSIIRKYKLDELPQLINVLKGEMSLVGPRPEVPKFTKNYTDEQQKVLTVRPGITDPASIYYKDEHKLLAVAENPEVTYKNDILPHKLKLSMTYVQNQNLINYFKYIFLTFYKMYFSDTNGHTDKTNSTK